jgi:hypothetical protein
VSLSEIELPEIASFIASQSGRDKDVVQTHLRWFLLENQARQPDVPLGYGLRSAGKLVGCILVSPQFFQFESHKILFMGSSSFYVDEEYRGHGGRIFLQYCRLGKSWPLFGTSANASAAALWKAAGANPIPYSDGELFGVLNWRPVAEEVAHRRYSRPFLTRLAASPLSNLAGILGRLKIEPAPDALRRLTTSQQVDDLSIAHPPSKLTALRDQSYIQWRYFSGQDPTTVAFAFRTQQPDREVLVTVNQRPRGYRGQIKTLNILDLYPEVSANEWLRIVGSLIACYSKSVDAIVLRSLDPDLQEQFVERGFKLRLFDACNAWFLDKKKLLPAHAWYPVPADGDGLI